MKAIYITIFSFEILIEGQQGKGWGIIPRFTKECKNEYEINNKRYKIIISKK